MTSFAGENWHKESQELAGEGAEAYITSSICAVVVLKSQTLT